MEFMKQLVFFDIDGTLLNDKKKLLPSTIEAINDLHKKGIHVCLASGRGYSEGIEDLVKELKLKDYLVLANGNYVYDIKNSAMIILGTTLNEVIIEYFVDKAKKYKCQLNLFFEDGSISYYYFGKDPIKEIDDEKFFIIGPKIKKYQPLHQLEDDLKKPIVHLGIKSSSKIIHKLFKEVHEFEFLNMVQVSTVSNVFLEVESLGVSKWLGIQYVQSKLEIENENTYAFGDSLNDEIMLDHIGNPVLMGNAEDELKHKYPTIIGTNNTPAISEFLKKEFKL